MSSNSHSNNNALKNFLNPVDMEKVGYMPSQYDSVLGDHIIAYTKESGFPSIPKHGLVMLGVPEDRGAFRNDGCGLAPNSIRRYLYHLAVPHERTGIVDFGDLVVGQTLEDTYAALCEVVSQLYEKGNTVMLLGGSQDISYGVYMVYAKTHTIVNMATIDSRFDLDDYDEVNSRSWFRKLLMYNPNALLFHSNIGYQTYFVGRQKVELMDSMKFDAFRLGEVQKDMQRAEALIRAANFVSVDVSAIRQSDAPGNGDASPHGFYGEEFCTMMRYAGMNENLNCLGIFEVSPLYDNLGQTSHMVAQGLWYFIEGFYCRQKDSPTVTMDKCKHFMVAMEDGRIIDFYKSTLSDRWWVAVPCENDGFAKIFGDHYFLPCTYADYQEAMTGETPELWWRYYQRMAE